MKKQQNPAFNVSVGMEVNVTMNVTMAKLFSSFIREISNNPQIMDILESDTNFGGVPSQIFSLASNCYRQAQIAESFARGSVDSRDSREDVA